MRVADAIAQWLKEKEIRQAFGIIGGGNHILFDSIHRLGYTDICCNHHEQASAMASCYYNRIAGTLGSVVLCTTGAGSTNAITGVMAAWMDSIPLLVLSGNEASKYMNAPTRTWGVQGYDSALAVDGYTKGSWRMGKMSVLDVALKTAMKPRQGPCWVDVPKDVQNAAV